MVRRIQYFEILLDLNHEPVKFIQTLKEINLLLIENVANLTCAVDFNLEEQLRVLIISGTEGDDIILDVLLFSRLQGLQ